MKCDDYYKLATVHTNTRSNADNWHFVGAAPLSESTPCSKLTTLRTLSIVDLVAKTWRQEATISRPCIFYEANLMSYYKVRHGWLQIATSIAKCDGFIIN